MVVNIDRNFNGKQYQKENNVDRKKPHQCIIGLAQCKAFLLSNILILSFFLEKNKYPKVIS